jgi:hypothetical protein
MHLNNKLKKMNKKIAKIIKTKWCVAKLLLGNPFEAIISESKANNEVWIKKRNEK